MRTWSYWLAARPAFMARGAVCAFSAALFLGASSARAQTAQASAAALQVPPPSAPAQAAPPAEPEPERKWELEVHGGASFSRVRTGQLGAVPNTGSTTNGLITVSTFYLGTGNQLFNQNAAALGAPAIATLDPVLVGTSLERRPGALVGLRLSRTLGSRFGIDLSADYSYADLAFTSGALAGLEASRASFAPALTRALSAASLPPSASALVTLDNRQRGAQLIATGALLIKLKTSGNVIPYLSAGGGVIVERGSTPSAIVLGTYQIGNPAVITGTDAVTVHYDVSSPAPLGLAGAGVKYYASPRWGLRFDGRAHFFRDPFTTLVDIAPGRALTSTGAAFPVVSAGGLRFSAIAPMSAIGGTDLATRNQLGLRVQVTATAGIFLRF